MKVGDLVRFNGPRSLFGIITMLDPFKDRLHTEIFWADALEKNGMIISVWCNDDFEVIL